MIGGGEALFPGKYAVLQGGRRRFETFSKLSLAVARCFRGEGGWVV
jgi:hypothetical protein